MEWKGLIPMAKKLASKNASPILLATGTAGFIATIAMSVKAAPKVEEELNQIDSYREEGYSTKEIALHEIKTLAPCCAPVIFVGGMSLGCFYGAVHVQGRKNAALAAAASISERALISYQDKVIEKFGEEEHGKLLEGIADDILADKIAKGDYSGETTLEEVETGIVPVEGSGETLCYDKVTGRYFKSSPEKIRTAEATVVKQCIDEMSVPLNEFYTNLGLDDVSVIGEAVGWDISKISPDIRFSSMLDSDGSTPVLVLNYHTCLIRRGMLEGVY